VKPTNGKRPRTERKLMVQFRQGVIAGPYTAPQIRWNDNGDPFDVVAAAYAAKDA
jgi:hypothetical protein